jgi:hypothetical protein
MRATAGAVVVATLIFGAARLLAGANAEPVAPSSGVSAARALDFLVANVCLDTGGNVLIGVSPIDGDPRCVAQRNLRPGEPLPYHVRESPAAGAGDIVPQRGSDSFPIQTRALGTLAIHLFDFWRGSGPHAFDQFDPAVHIGGGSIAEISGDTASFIATQLGRPDLQLFVGRGCEPGQPVTATALRDAWVLAPLDKLAALDIPSSPAGASGPIAGGIVSMPAGMVEDIGAGARCSTRPHYSTTRWSIRPVTYRAVYKSGPQQGTHVRLWTLTAEHFGSGANNLDTALGFERAYFTRELGWTRWEGWKSANWAFRGKPNLASDMPGGKNSRILAVQDRIIRRGNCGLPDSPAADSGYSMPPAPTDSRAVPRPDLAIVGCFEVTDIVPPQNKSGDPAPIGPGSWYYSIINNANSAVAALFAQ